MAGRRYFLVCYDIRDPKRLTRTRKVMKGYGEPWQYSVFFCALRGVDKVRMEEALRNVMKMSEDQALIVDLGTDEKSARAAMTVIGQGLPPFAESMEVI